MVTLRELRDEDAELMLEWMHNKNVVRYMNADFANMTIDDCRRFIHSSKLDENNLHLAVTDNNVYMGTVSLKNIKAGRAEFAITIREEAMGRNVSNIAMKQIIELGFQKKKLKEIYWYVSKKNERAIKFYDKNGYRRINKPIEELENPDYYIWYLVDNAS